MNLNRNFAHKLNTRNMKNSHYSLHGIIFQEGYHFGIADKPGIGAAATINKAMNYAMFHGVIHPTELYSDIYEGELSDYWGPSVITDFLIKEDSISFKKQYTGKPVIDYHFRKCEEGVWFGVHSSAYTGKGTAKLIMIPVDESFFSPVDMEI